LSSQTGAQSQTGRGQRAAPHGRALGQVDGETQVAKPLPLVQGRIVELTPEGTWVKKGAALLKLDDGMLQGNGGRSEGCAGCRPATARAAKDLPEQYRLKEKQQQAAITPPRPKESVKLEQRLQTETGRD